MNTPGPGTPVLRTPRLKKRAQFLRVAGKGRKVATPGMVVQVLREGDGPGSDVSGGRVGFTVTKKVGNSVIRNRTKRRLREAFRLVAREDGLAPGDYVLIGREGTRARPFDLLKGDLRHALRKAARRAGEPGEGGKGEGGK